MGAGDSKYQNSTQTTQAFFVDILSYHIIRCDHFVQHCTKNQERTQLAHLRLTAINSTILSQHPGTNGCVWQQQNRNRQKRQRTQTITVSIDVATVLVCQGCRWVAEPLCVPSSLLVASCERCNSRESIVYKVHDNVCLSCVREVLASHSSPRQIVEYLVKFRSFNRGKIAKNRVVDGMKHLSRSNEIKRFDILSKRTERLFSRMHCFLNISFSY